MASSMQNVEKGCEDSEYDSDDIISGAGDTKWRDLSKKMISQLKEKLEERRVKMLSDVSKASGSANVGDTELLETTDSELTEGSFSNLVGCKARAEIYNVMNWFDSVSDTSCSECPTITESFEDISDENDNESKTQHRKKSDYFISDSNSSSESLNQEDEEQKETVLNIPKAVQNLIPETNLIVSNEAFQDTAKSSSNLIYIDESNTKMDGKQIVKCKSETDMLLDVLYLERQIRSELPEDFNSIRLTSSDTRCEIPATIINEENNEMTRADLEQSNTSTLYDIRQSNVFKKDSDNLTIGLEYLSEQNIVLEIDSQPHKDIAEPHSNLIPNYSELISLIDDKVKFHSGVKKHLFSEPEFIQDSAHIEGFMNKSCNSGSSSQGEDSIQRANTDFGCSAATSAVLRQRYIHDEGNQKLQKCLEKARLVNSLHENLKSTRSETDRLMAKRAYEKAISEFKISVHDLSVGDKKDEEFWNSSCVKKDIMAASEIAGTSQIVSGVPVYKPENMFRSDTFVLEKGLCTTKDADMIVAPKLNKNVYTKEASEKLFSVEENIEQECKTGKAEHHEENNSETYNLNETYSIEKPSDGNSRSIDQNTYNKTEASDIDLVEMTECEDNNLTKQEDRCKDSKDNEKDGDLKASNKNNAKLESSNSEDAVDKNITVEKAKEVKTEEMKKTNASTDSENKCFDEEKNKTINNEDMTQEMEILCQQDELDRTTKSDNLTGNKAYLSTANETKEECINTNNKIKTQENNVEEKLSDVSAHSSSQSDYESDFCNDSDDFPDLKLSGANSEDVDKCNRDNEFDGTIKIKQQETEEENDLEEDQGPIESSLSLLKEMKVTECDLLGHLDSPLYKNNEVVSEKITCSKQAQIVNKETRRPYSLCSPGKALLKTSQLIQKLPMLSDLSSSEEEILDEVDRVDRNLSPSVILKKKQRDDVDGKLEELNRITQRQRKSRSPLRLRNGAGNAHFILNSMSPKKTVKLPDQMNSSNSGELGEIDGETNQRNVGSPEKSKILQDELGALKDFENVRSKKDANIENRAKDQTWNKIESNSKEAKASSINTSSDRSSHSRSDTELAISNNSSSCGSASSSVSGEYDLQVVKSLTPVETKHHKSKIFDTDTKVRLKQKIPQKHEKNNDISSPVLFEDKDVQKVVNVPTIFDKYEDSNRPNGIFGEHTKCGLNIRDIETDFKKESQSIEHIVRENQEVMEFTMKSPNLFQPAYETVKQGALIHHTRLDPSTSGKKKEDNSTNTSYKNSQLASEASELKSIHGKEFKSNEFKKVQKDNETQTNILTADHSEFIEKKIYKTFSSKLDDLFNRLENIEVLINNASLKNEIDNMRNDSKDAHKSSFSTDMSIQTADAEVRVSESICQTDSLERKCTHTNTDKDYFEIVDKSNAVDLVQEKMNHLTDAMHETRSEIQGFTKANSDLRGIIQNTAGDMTEKHNDLKGKVKLELNQTMQHLSTALATSVKEEADAMKNSIIGAFREFSQETSKILHGSLTNTQEKLNRIEGEMSEVKKQVEATRPDKEHNLSLDERLKDYNALKLKVVDLISQRDAEKAFHKITRESMRAMERDHERLREKILLNSMKRRASTNSSRSQKQFHSFDNELSEYGPNSFSDTIGDSRDVSPKKAVPVSKSRCTDPHCLDEKETIIKRRKSGFPIMIRGEKISGADSPTSVRTQRSKCQGYILDKSAAKTDMKEKRSSESRLIKELKSAHSKPKYAIFSIKGDKTSNANNFDLINKSSDSQDTLTFEPDEMPSQDESLIEESKLDSGNASKTDESSKIENTDANFEILDDSEIAIG